MKANLYIILLSFIVLVVIAIATKGQPHFTMILPLAYIGYSFIVGLIAFFRNRFY